MMDPDNVPEVTAEEKLARYVLSSSHIRQKGSVRPEAFMPSPYTELSVTRHRDAIEEEVWTSGRNVADVRGKTLHGRADFIAGSCTEKGLQVESDPLLNNPDPRLYNPNHANVANWPSEKSAQKAIALALAAEAEWKPVQKPDQ